MPPARNMLKLLSRGYRQRHARMSLRFIVYGSLFLGVPILVSLILPAAGSHGPSREASLQRQLVAHISTALIIYKSEKGNFPPVVCYSNSGKVPYSWRIELLPYLETAYPDEFDGASKVYEEYHFDEPWNSDHNRHLAQRSRNFYAISNFKDTGNCLAIVGEDGNFNQDREAFCLFGSHLESSMILHKSSIILIQLQDAGIPWMKPKDIVTAEVQEKINLGISLDKPNDYESSIGASDGSTHHLYDLEICPPSTE